MAFFALDNKIAIIAIVVVCVAVVAALVAVLVVRSKKSRKAKAQQVEQQQQMQQQQVEQRIEQGVQQKLIEKRNEYLVLARNVTFSAGVDGQIAAGSYLLKSAHSGETKFNIRLNGIVQQYSDGDVVTLGPDDTICCVSGSALIKPYVDDIA